MEVVHAAEAHGEADLSAAFLWVVQTAVLLAVALSPIHQDYQALPWSPHQDSPWEDPAHPSFQEVPLQVEVPLVVDLWAGGLSEVIPAEVQGKLHPEASSVDPGVALHPVVVLLAEDLEEETLVALVVVLVKVLEEEALGAMNPMDHRDSFLERLETPLAGDHAVGGLGVGVLEEAHLMVNRTQENPVVIL